MRLSIFLFIGILAATSCRNTDLAIVKLNNKFGCIDRQGNFVVKPNWDWMLQGDKQILVKKNSLFGFLDRKGKIIIPPIYNNGNSFYEGLAAVGNGEKYGFINVKGDTVIPFEYEDVFLGFSNGLAVVRKYDCCGYIDKTGKVIIPFKYETCNPFLSEFSTVYAYDEETKLIDKKGTTSELKKKNYNGLKLWVLDTGPGNFIESKTGRGRVNEKGDTLIPPIYSQVSYFIEKRSTVELNKRFGIYDDKGNLIVESKFEDITYFSEGLAAFKLNGKWGYLDRHGEVVIEPNYDYVEQFSRGLAYVEVNGQVGFIDKKGKMAIEPRFQMNRGGNFSKD